MNMSQITVMFKLDEVSLSALRQEAHKNKCDMASIMRDALSRELRRRHRAQTKKKTNPHEVAALRALLAEDFAKATSWNDLCNRVSSKGYNVRPSGGGLAVFHPTNDRRIAKASEFGTSYGHLVERFQCPFPSHDHQAAHAQILHHGGFGGLR